MKSLANNPYKIRKEEKKYQIIIGLSIFSLIENSIFRIVVPGYLHIASGIVFIIEIDD